MTAAVVAPGHSIWGPPDPAAAASFAPFVYMAPPTVANPGDSVDLADDDYLRCLASGAIVDPNELTVPGPGGSTQIVPG